MHSKTPADELTSLARSWKTNMYLIRYWANLIREPDLLLDCHKSPAITASLNCIAQAFEDSSLGKPPVVDNETPIDRLLFIRDIPRYKQMTDRFFNEIGSYQTISDHELHFYLNEFSKCQQQVQQNQPLGQTISNNTTRRSTEISSLQVFTQLYEYYERLEQPVNALLGQQQCSVLLPVHHRLVQIKELLVSNGQAMPMTLNRMQYSQNTLNPYQQPVNCYATASATVASSDFNHFSQSNSNQNTSFTINNQNFLFNNNNNNGMSNQASSTASS